MLAYDFFLYLFLICAFSFDIVGGIAAPFDSFSNYYVQAKTRIKPITGNEVLRTVSIGTGPAADTASFRYYDKVTAEYRVEALPDMPFSIGEMYSGLMPVKSGDNSRQLFFIFQPTIGVAVDSLTIWLNGGPGCSSLEGFLQENGRFVWRDGMPRPQLNEHSWSNLTNILYVEYPVGVGFTVGESNAKSQEDSAQDFLGFFRNFQDTFGLKNYKIYVSGESYAGRYVPYISSAMIDAKDKQYFDLAGAVMYDPCIGAYNTVQQQYPVVPLLRANQRLLGLQEDFMEQMERIHETCGYREYIDKHLTFPASGLQPPQSGRFWAGCDVLRKAQAELTKQNECFDIYMINSTCSPYIDPIKGDGKTQPAYFDRADVKRALHAPEDTKWELCNDRPMFFGAGGGPEGNGDLSKDPIQHVLPKVISATNRVLVANGDYDLIIMTNGTLLSLQNMTWGGTLGFQNRPSTPIFLDGSQAQRGIQHFERGLMFSQAFGAGHMGPEYSPEISLRHLEWVLGRRNTL